MTLIMPLRRVRGLGSLVSLDAISTCRGTHSFSAAGTRSGAISRRHLKPGRRSRRGAAPRPKTDEPGSSVSATIRRFAV
jgi:hypothetical protein